MIVPLLSDKQQQSFNQFVKKNHLTSSQAQQFLAYLHLLRTHNEVVNLTAITDPEEIIELHFQDSLAFASFVDCSQSLSMVDVGSGAGFPGIPLKIAFPHLRLHLVEVTNKKIAFLQQVIEALSLKDIDVHSSDWRTFLRKTKLDIDYIVSRASLPVEELLRIFKPSLPYSHARVVYWASSQWVPSMREKECVQATYAYTVKNRKRTLVCFSGQACRE